MDSAETLGVVVGSILMALAAGFWLPKAAWDLETGRYRGYFNKNAILVSLLIVVFFGYVAFRMEKPGPEAGAYVLAQLFIVLALSRICVELSHKSKFGIWLHRRYHKMTDHEDPREASP